MSSGRCLCGTVSWEISGVPIATYHCHCSMCRKAHGAAFGSYYYISIADFRWTGDEVSIVHYASSPTITRSFCGNCGSVVPDKHESGEFIYVPAGSHDEGPAISEHIFVASKAPWYEITDSLSQHETYPEGDSSHIYADKSLPVAPAGVVRGSCLCGSVEFHLTEAFKVIHNCHCTRCRQARSAPFTTNGFVSTDGIVIDKGEQHIAAYKPPSAQFFTHAFCDTCGSGVPRVDAARNIAVIPLGALDDDPGSRPLDNIYIGSKAAWFEITDNLPRYQQGPPSAPPK